MKVSRWALWSALVLALLADRAAVAQERFSTITGTVVDESEAAIPGVSVTLTHLETKRSIARTTDTDGPASRPPRWLTSTCCSARP